MINNLTSKDDETEKQRHIIQEIFQPAKITENPD